MLSVTSHETLKSCVTVKIKQSFQNTTDIQSLKRFMKAGKPSLSSQSACHDCKNAQKQPLTSFYSKYFSPFLHYLLLTHLPVPSCLKRPYHHVSVFLGLKTFTSSVWQNKFKGFLPRKWSFCHINHLPPCLSKLIKALFVCGNKLKIFWMKTERLVTAKQLTRSRPRTVKTSSK